MSRKILLTLVCVACLLVARVASIQLSIRPRHLRVSDARLSVTFTCTADVALAGCQFRLWDAWGNGGAGPLLELSRGSLSQPNPSHFDSHLTGYSYSGRGLGAGDCGVSLQVENNTQGMVACRVRAKTGGWTYAWADLVATIFNPLPHTLYTREVVVLPGGEARLSLKTQVSLQWCNFVWPGVRPALFFLQGAQSESSTGRHLYLGAGVEDGDCGLALANVSEADNGLVGMYIYNREGFKYDMRVMALIVARPPGAPSLSYVYNAVGITATCEVRDGRPVASITWLVDDEVLRQDSVDDSPGNPQDEWRWPWTHGSILQKLTITHDKYDRKDLKCVVSHASLPRPLEAKTKIWFPVAPGEPWMSVGYTEDSIKATCYVPEGYPTFNISWVLGDKVLPREFVDNYPGSPVFIEVLYQELTVPRQDKYNGWVLKCQVHHVTLAQPLEATKVISFPEPPGAPTLSLVHTDVGVTATCVVRDGRPAANISWLLGDEVLSDSLGSPQQPSDQGSVIQNLTVKRQDKYNGKVLKCVVSHVTLAQPLEAEKVVLFPGVSSYNLSITPDSKRASKDPQSINFNCRAGVPLAGCQFRWWDFYTKAGPLLELSRGYQSQVDPTYLDSFFTGYSYSGQGLEAGDCGISMDVNGLKFWMVGCRVRTKTGGWTYAWATLYADDKGALFHTTTPREAVVRPGKDATFSLKAQEPLSRCQIYTSDVNLDFYHGAASEHSTGRYRYLGGGVDAGECGLTLANVGEADNGPIGFYLENTARTKAHFGHVPLIIARRPSPPTLSVDYSAAGLTATCLVRQGRPVATISWVLGDDVLLQDSQDSLAETLANPLDEWRWPWVEGSIQQTVTLERKPEYHGLVLKCLAHHVTLGQSWESTVLIWFQS